MKKLYTPVVQLYLRLALAAGFISPCLDRLGAYGANGRPGVVWGDWAHFSSYTHSLMPFFPEQLTEILAIVATIAELVFGVLLIIGLFIRCVSILAGSLTLIFAVCMATTSGIRAPLNYAVFTVSAAAFLLATIRTYRWSIDNISRRKNAISGWPVILYMY